MEVDLLRFWRVDLLDYLRRPRTISTRRLMVLVSNIPRGQGSAIRSIGGHEWTTTDDLLDEIRRRYVHVHYEGDELPPPHPLAPRPPTDDGGEVTDVDVAAWERRRADRRAQLALVEDHEADGAEGNRGEAGDE